jgi:hypothetical protein
MAVFFLEQFDPEIRGINFKRRMVKQRS